MSPAEPPRADPGLPAGLALTVASSATLALTGRPLPVSAELRNDGADELALSYDAIIFELLDQDDVRVIEDGWQHGATREGVLAPGARLTFTDELALVGPQAGARRAPLLAGRYFLRGSVIVGLGAAVRPEHHRPTGVGRRTARAGSHRPVFTSRGLTGLVRERRFWAVYTLGAPVERPLMLLSRTRVRAAAVAGAVAAALAVPVSAHAAVAAGSPRQVFVKAGAGVVGLDIATGRLGVPVELPEEVSGFGVSPDARTLWLISYGGSNVPVDIASRSLGTDLGTIGCGNPHFSPDGRYSWQVKGCSFDDSGPVVDRQDLRTGALLRLPLGPDDIHPDVPLSVLLSPDGGTAYVTVVPSDGRHAVRLVDAATGALGALLPVPGGVGRLLTPDGRTLVLIGAARVTLLDLPTGAVRTTALVAVSGGWAVTPDGTTAWLAVGQSIVPLDLRTARLGTAIALGGTPRGVAVAPGGTRAFVGVERATGSSGLVSVDLVARTVSAVLVEGGTQPVVMPSQAPHAAYAVSCRAGANRFDASASRAVNGRVARYDWTFGDGTRASTTTPVVSHTYAGSTRRTVSLTVTDLSGTSTQRVFDGSQVLRNGGPAARTSRTVAAC